MRPLAIDLFCGSFGWSAGWLELGGRVVGFDLEHEPHHGPVPRGADLVLQDVRTINGAQFRDASLIVASSPCQEFSYRAMPWKRAKALGPPLLGMELFAQAFRIQREAIAAAGHFIPMVQENVRGANPWVKAEFGRSRWSYGSYHLWGDVPALMPITFAGVKVGGLDWSKYGQPGYKALGFNTTADQHTKRILKGVKLASDEGRRTDVGKGARFTSQDCGDEGIKQGGDRFDDPQSVSRRTSSKSNARKAASARIAKIPLPLARWVARCYYPEDKRATA